VQLDLPCELELRRVGRAGAGQCMPNHLLRLCPRRQWWLRGCLSVFSAVFEIHMHKSFLTLP
jgi:hypothetical protein